MKRCLVGAVLLLLLPLGGWLALGETERALEPVTEALEQAESAALEGRFTRAEALTAGAEARWRQSRKTLAALCGHEPLERIDCLFSRLSLSLSTRDGETAAHLCRELVRTADTLPEQHRLTWENLL